MNRLAILLLSAMSISAYAEKSEDDPFQAELELGAIVTSGNTESSTFKGKANIKQERTKWRNNFVLEGLYKRDELDIEDTDTPEEGDTYREDRTTAQKYFASAQSDYKLNSEHQGLFIFGSYEDDRFSGYEYQSTLAAGYSDRLFETENSHFDYSVGPGLAFSKEEDTEDEAGNIEEHDSVRTEVLRAAFEYIYRISENAKFSQVVASDIAVNASENTRTRSETALSVNINSTLAMKLSYLIKQNTHVQEDKRHADSQTAVTLVFSF